MIDPLGLALENFNAIGQWRDKDIDAGVAIDAAGAAWPDGTQLEGAGRSAQRAARAARAVRADLHRESR